MKRMIWQFSWFACLVLSLVAAARLARAQIPVAADPPRQGVPEALEKLFQDIDEESLKESPRRDYKIEKGAAQQVKLFLADPKLLENKVHASIVLFTIPPTNDDGRQAFFRRPSDAEMLAIRELPQFVPRLVEHQSGNLIFSGHYTGISTKECPSTKRGYLKLLASLCRESELPEQSVLEFLTSPACDRDIRWSFGFVDHRQIWVFEVFAPSEEAVQQRVNAVLLLLDNGLCRPLQRDCLAEARNSLEAARKGYVDVSAVNQTIRAEEDKLAKPSEITPDILTQLKGQKITLVIELAGLNARVKACNEMLKAEDRLLRAARESINDEKVKAEIELAGIKQKLDQVNTFVAEGEKREAIRIQTLEMKKKVSELRGQIRQQERRAEAYARLVSLYAPLELKDNQITISPVEWTN